MRKDLYEEMYQQEDTYWWHVGKRKLVLSLLKKYAKRRWGLKLVDMGCGTGKMMEDLEGWGEVWGVDFNDHALRFCRKRGHHFLSKADLSKRFPFKSNTFEVVLALDLLEHLEDDQLALSEFSRVLKKDGILIITVPAYQFLWSYWDEMAGHRRRYSRKSLSSRLKKTRFLPKRISYYNSFVLPVAIFYRFFKGIVRKKNRKFSSDFIPLPSVIDQMLLSFLIIERMLIKVVDLPVGLSLICIAKKG